LIVLELANDKDRLMCKQVRKSIYELTTFFKHCWSFTLVILLGSCATAHRPYHSVNDTEAQADLERDRVAVIEFDERGDYWESRQIRRAEALIRKVQAPVLVTYIHGWRHDAKPDDGDLRSFRNFIKNLNEAVDGRACGVFVGWRGASVEEGGLIGAISEPISLLSFWGRKKITDQMAGVPFAQTLWKLAETTKASDGHSILIGHSFGGRIVERTLGTTAIAQMNNGQSMPYNLTFLINPATESLYARQLKLALRQWKSNQPAIVAIAAKDDFATGTAWPIALLRPSRIRSRDYVIPLPSGTITESQKEYVKSTVGNDKRQWTHKLQFEATRQYDPKANVTAENLIRSTSTPFELRLRGEDEGKLATCRVVELSGVEAKHQLSSKAYWVLPVEKNVLSGHGGVAGENGIFSSSMSDLMAGIIRQVGAVLREAPVVPLSDPGKVGNSDAPPPSKFPLRLLIP
jgi:hypothetical protein